MSVAACAQAFVDAGFCVIPVRPDGSKQPSVAWKEFQSRVPTEREMRRWFSVSDVGIGVVTGQVSGSLEVIDFDEPGIYDAFETACVEAGVGDLLRRCALVQTGSGYGRQLYYRAPGIGRNTKLAMDAEGQVRIETRAEGGYAVAPPSNGTVHPSGGAYKFLREARPNTVPTITADERAALHAVARSFDQAPAEVRSSGPLPHGNGTGDRPGDAYNASGDFEAVLERHGWRRIATRSDGTTDWRRPGKHDGGKSATTGYTDLPGIFVFSSNAAPFDPDRRYSPFDVLTLLDHHGDYSAAAKYLARQLGPAPAMQQTTAKAPEAKRASLLRPIPFSDVLAKSVPWVWHGYLAREAMTELNGDPGRGKGLVSIDLAARMSRGDAMPDGMPLDGPLRVLFLTAEDSVEYTEKPRLAAAGACMSRVFCMPPIVTEDGLAVHPSIPAHIGEIEACVTECGADVLIVDPLSEFLDAHDSHKDTDVRRMLQPLTAMARRTHCAILVVRHLNKGSGMAAIYRAGGSVAFTAAARLAYAIGQHPDEPSRRVMACVKNNLSQHPQSLVFEIVAAGETARVDWHGACDLTADDILAGAKSQRPRDEAADFLRDALHGGPTREADVQKLAMSRGISKATLHRAKVRIGVRSEKVGHPGAGGHWLWSLPDEETQSAKRESLRDVAGEGTQSAAKGLTSKSESLSGGREGTQSAESESLRSDGTKGLTLDVSPFVESESLGAADDVAATCREPGCRSVPTAGDYCGVHDPFGDDGGSPSARCTAASGRDEEEFE